MTFKKLITHDNCADGLASAMIVRDAIPDIEIVFAQYGQPSLEALPAEEGLLFCDISPPRESVAEFVAAGATVLDHHKHARDVVEAFGDRGVFADEIAEPGVSGAVLAYVHVWMPTVWHDGFPRARQVSDFARWTGIRDTWQKGSPEWELANDLHSVLMGLPREFWLRPGGISKALGGDMLELGRLFRDKRLAKARELAASGCILVRGTDDRVWGTFPDPAAYTSDVAEALRERGIPLCCGWFQQVTNSRLETVLSLRSDGSVDVGALASTFGGGGHSKAAGCRIDESNALAAVVRVTAGRP